MSLQAVHPRVKTRIQDEKKTLTGRSVDEIRRLLQCGKSSRVIGHIMFFASYEDIAGIIDAAELDYKKCADQQSRSLYHGFFVDLAVSFSSALVSWRLKDLISEKELRSLVDRIRSIVAALPNDSELLSRYAREIKQRYTVEARDESETVAAAQRVAQGTLAGFVDDMCREIAASVLFQNTMLSGHDKTVWGNDYGAFLQFALWCGATFQTTNPPLVQAAYDLNSEYWNKNFYKVLDEIDRDALPAEGLSESAQLTSLLSYSVIEKSCHLVRDLYVFLDGDSGFVCYQVNPYNNHDADAMIREVKFIHAVMEQRLDGYEPNLSFKLPGTLGGLQAAEVLSREGISLTITLSFGLFQLEEFAKVLSQGNALVSSVVVMNGRLAFPVRDEITVSSPEDEELLYAARYAGVDITRRAYKRLYHSPESGGLGIDPDRVRIMNASLRIYGSEIPDVMDIWGTPSITIFPNVRHALDGCKREFNQDVVEQNVSEEIRKQLGESEIFCQAWWIPGLKGSYQPKQVLSLRESSHEDIVNWIPIDETLTQFLAAYDTTKGVAEHLADKYEGA